MLIAEISTKTRYFACCLAGLLLAFVQPANSTDRTWTGAVSNDWFNIGNWSPDTGFLDGADNLLMNSGTSQANSIVKSDNGGSISLQGSLTNVEFTGGMYIGENNTGTLNILNGASLLTSGSNPVFVGFNTNSSGTININNAGWQNSDFLYLGFYGSGALNITNGGTYTSSYGISARGNNYYGATGSVLVDGAGSKLTTSQLFFGEYGLGELIVSAGGTVVTDWAVFGQGSFGSANVVIDGAGSSMTVNQNIQAGYNSNIKIRNGAAVTANVVQIGRFTGENAVVTVEGTSSSLITNAWNASLDVGAEGFGQLNIKNGATVTGSSLVAADGSPSATVGGTGIINVDGIGSRLGLTSDISLGFKGTGVLNVSSGGVVSASNLVVHHSHPGLSKSSVNISGVGATADISGTLITNSGSEIQVLNGGLLKSGNASIGDNYYNPDAAVVNIIGNNTQWNNNLHMEIGSYAHGSLKVDQGASVTTDTLILGRNNMGSMNLMKGIVNVNASGSLLTTTGNTIIGDKGYGEFSVTGAAHVKTGAVSVAQGDYSVGIITVAGAGSRWDASGQISAGILGNGTINVTNGGQIASNYAILGSPMGALEANVNIDGAASRWDILNTLENIRGNITITNGGTLTNHDAKIGRNAPSPSYGYSTLDTGGNWHSSGNVSVEGYDVIVVRDGNVTIEGALTNGATSNISIELSNTGTFRARTINNTAGGVFYMAGGKLSADTFNGNLKIYGGGKLDPGEKIGSMAINGNYAMQSAGAGIHIDIAGTGINEYDTVNVSGNAILGGILEVSLFDSGTGLFIPRAGDTFDILTAQTITSSFSTLSFASLIDPNLTWHIDYLTDAIGTTDVVRLSFATSAVPIPAAVWLFGSGLLGLISAARRRVK